MLLCSSGQGANVWQPHQVSMTPGLPGHPPYTNQLPTMQTSGPPEKEDKPKTPIPGGVQKGGVVKIPKDVMVKIIETIQPMLDCTLTGKVDQQILAVIMWILSDTKPNFLVKDFMCSHFEDLAARFDKGADCLLRLVDRGFIVWCGRHQPIRHQIHQSWLVDRCMIMKSNPGRV